MSEDNLDGDAAKGPARAGLRTPAPDGVAWSRLRELVHVLVAWLLSHLVKPHRLQRGGVVVGSLRL